MSLDEPTMLGPTPEERLATQKRVRRVRIAAAAVIVIIAVGIGVALLPTTPSKTVYFDPYSSSCAGGANFSCSFVLDAKPGSTITVADVKNVLVNGTQPTYSVKPDGASVHVSLSMPSINMIRGLGDVGPSQRPPTTGQIVVYLTDGDTVSDFLGPSGILVPGHPGN